MADAGYHCYAPDWIGFGFSEMPQPGYGFDFKGQENVIKLKECAKDLVYCIICRGRIPQGI